MKKYLVIGNPIDHSLSPKLHNFWLGKNKLQAIYEKKKLEENEIKKLIQDVRNQDISGVNVTVPFKKTVIKYLDKLSPEAQQTQSVNTIILTNNYILGHNTDIFGFTCAIQKINYDIRDKKILILGAGGVVPSIIFALNTMGASQIIIANRTKQNAENLKIQFENIQVIDWGEMYDFDVVINATSLGLKNEVIELNFSKIGKNKLFYDVIYNPAETNFLRLGKELGHQVENGKLMFVYQALEAFKLWHGIEPKINKDILELLNND